MGRDVFFNEDLDGEEEDVTWDIFRKKLETQTMRDYFKHINVELSDAPALFEMIDLDASGSISSAELVRACLRLRGPARSLDLAMLTKFLTDTHSEVFEKLSAIELAVTSI